VFRPNGQATHVLAADAVDRMCDDSFPASDPPATWTWDVQSQQTRDYGSTSPRRIA
jgi:hypothetical protein